MNSPPGCPHRLERGDRLVAVGGVVAGPAPVVGGREVARAVALEAQQLLVALADHQHGRAGGSVSATISRIRCVSRS